MKGKKKYAIIISIAAVIVLMTTVLAMAGSDEKIVRDLIDERTVTLNNYYDGDMKKEEAREKIKKLETDNLMEQDLENIDLYFQTDIDRINEFEITSVKITHEDEDMICADVYIKWDVDTVTGSDSFICDYSVICVKEGNGYKLAQFF